MRHRRTRHTQSVIEAQKRRVIHEINSRVGGSNYELGGGHGGRHGPPYDCSGWQCHLIRVAGFPIEDMDTSLMAEHLEHGPGAWYTLHILSGQGGAEDHVVASLFDLRGRKKWNECGGRDNPQPGGGPTWFRPTAERIGEFHVTRHVRGM